MLGFWRMPAGASEPSAAAGSAGGNGESSSAVGVAPGACSSEPSAVQAALESVGVAPAAGASEPSAAAGGSDGADELVEETPRCAGVGDAEMASWVCWQCLVDLSGARPRMPLYALANDNWVGRERVEVKEASEATRWLSCLGRVCWKQLRLGHGAPDVQQRGIAGNTIFLAQPAVTLNSETLDLPPERDALVDCVNIAFTGSTGSLAKARWAQVKRAEYMRLVSRRRWECAAYAQADVDELAAATEWWFGDGAPNLARQRPMLFEEVAAMLLEREELQYSLESDEAPYTARAPSRFVAPEIVAVLGDVRRRLALLRGTRAATQRRGYKEDLQSICGATPEDYEAALGLARPRDSILAGQCNADGSGD